MLDSSELLAAARQFGKAAIPSDAEVRRAVSTAYYALFHALLTAAADRPIGAAHRGSVAYTIAYRHFSHDRIRQVCRALDKPRLEKEYELSLGRQVVPPDFRTFCGLFAELQGNRHKADYDPAAAFTANEVDLVCDAAEAAITLLGTLDAALLTDMFALMAFTARR